jgi:hypothetical protein
MEINQLLQQEAGYCAVLYTPMGFNSKPFAGVSGLFILDCPFTMLREFLDCLFLIAPSQFCGSVWIVYS